MLIAMQRQFLLQQIDEQRAKLAALDRQKAQKEAELATVEATVNKLEAVLPVLQQRVDIRETLYCPRTRARRRTTSKSSRPASTQQELAVQKSQLQEAEAAVAAIVEARAQTDGRVPPHAVRASWSRRERKAAGLSEDLVKATQRTQLQALTAPVDGIVQQLAVHTVGGVVTPAQALLVVVPADSHLEIEAMVSNRDIGFVHAGQEVEIKVDTFNFTRYGLLHGKVLSVSQDAITRDKPQDKTTDKAPGAETHAASRRARSSIYAARISLDRTQMQVDENLVNLSPGMAVTVEIKTGSRAVISYLLSPLLRYKQESLRER